MEVRHKVIFTGQLKPEVEMELAISAFSARFGTPAEAVRKLFENQREVVLKKDLDLDEARRYQEALERMGIIVRLDPAPQPEAVSDEPAGLSLEPKPEPEAVAEPETAAADDNPFAAPQADLDEDQQEGEMHAPVSVPAGHGWAWIKQSFALFKRNPFSWLGALLLWIVISMVLGLIPLVSFIVSLFSGVIAGGFMLGAHEQDQGGDFRVSHLFAGFSTNFGALLLLGVFYLIGIILIGVGMGITMGGAMVATGAAEGADPAAMQAMITSPAMLIPILIGATLITLLIMAYWFAPALVAIEGVSALTAMTLSFKACLKNMLPFLVYGIIATLLFIIGALPVFLGLLIVVPVIMASVYTGYRDIFYS